MAGSPPLASGSDHSRGQPSASQDVFQQEINKKVVSDLIARMSRCHNLGELLKTIPAPAQEDTKYILEKVTEAFTRQGACETLKRSWQDALNKREYKNIPELNSLKAPSVQISKLATEIDQVALNALNFDTVLADARKAALTQMIALKQQEINNLKTACDGYTIKGKIFEAWKVVANVPGITPEHAFILTSPNLAERLVQMAISIGHNSLTRSSNIKQRRLEKKAEPEVEKMDVDGNQKSLRALIQEQLKRERQSEKDKKIHARNAKKGSGRAGPPKTPKNPKNSADKVQKKGPRKSARKAGPSTKRRQGKR